MKVLYFDVEHGSQTLGSKETIAKEFGLPMLNPSSWNEFQQTIAKIYKTEKVTEKIDMGGGLSIDQVKSKISPRENFSADTVVIDTFSELSKKFQRSLVNKKTGVMKLQDWGVLKHRIDGLLDYISRIPGIVI